MVQLPLNRGGGVTYHNTVQHVTFFVPVRNILVAKVVQAKSMTSKASNKSVLFLVFHQWRIVDLQKSTKGLHFFINLKKKPILSAIFRNKQYVKHRSVIQKVSFRPAFCGTPLWHLFTFSWLKFPQIASLMVLPNFLQALCFYLEYRSLCTVQVLFGGPISFAMCCDGGIIDNLLMPIGT